MLIGFILNVLVNGAAFLLIARLLPGFTVRKPETAIAMGIVYGILTGVIGWLLGASIVAAVVFMLLLVPLLGILVAVAAYIASFLVGFLLSILVLVATDAMIEDFSMDGPATAVIAAFLLAVINTLLGGVLRLIF